MSCISSCFCCRSSPSNNPKTHIPKFHQCVRVLYDFLVLSTKVVASAILIATILWLFIRLPEPSVYLTGMQIELIDPSFNKPNSTLLHYNLTLRNGDLYKNLYYDVLVLRITHSDYSTYKGFTIDFIKNRKALHQGPGETTLLPNNTIDYSSWWENKYMTQFKNQTQTIDLRFVMETRFGVFNRYVRRQAMRTAKVYFDNRGKAFINKRRGLKLK